MLRNTDYVYGLVIYTGHDTKLLMNASATPIKKSRLERMVNKQITAIFALLFTMAIVCVIGYVVWVSRNNKRLDCINISLVRTTSLPTSRGTLTWKSEPDWKTLPSLSCLSSCSTRSCPSGTFYFFFFGKVLAN